jgi:pimeloyl-ACP methyl ester carboxylesterase
MRPPAILLLFLVCAPVLPAGGVTVRWDPRDPAIGPFPNDFLTVPDPSQKSGRRINLPMPPDCTAAPSDCQDVQLINQLDGFQTAPRIRVSFSAPIDVNTLYNAIYYVPLDNLTREEPGINQFGQKIPINQIIYDPTTNTVYAKPDGNLDQHRHVAIVVTDKIHDLAGDPVRADGGYAVCAQQSNDWARANWYCRKLASAVNSVAAEFAPYNVVGGSIFTTMNVTTWLEKAHAQLQNLAPSAQRAAPQAVFQYSDISSLVLHFQTTVSPAQFVDVPLPIKSPLFSGIGALAFGSFSSPNFLNGDNVIPWTPTGQDVALPGPVNQVYFHAFLPSSPAPSTGYPVVIFGHGFGDSQWGGPSTIAPVLAQAGFATVAINAVGHGFGPQSSVIVTDNAGNSTTMLTGGRGVDLNGDGTYDPYEGCVAINPGQVGMRDCLRQTALDLSQLVHTIQVGLDLNGDGIPDLDPNRIYYGGQSLGAIYGTIFSALEPRVRASLLNVGGGTIVDIVRWSDSYHALAAAELANRMPSLLNEGSNFNDNYVFPFQPVKVNDVPGAIDIQNAFELYEWLESPGDPVYYAPHLVASSLPGVPAKHILFQFARADTTMPNVATTRLINAAFLRPSTWEYRHDLALADGLQVAQDPHPFLVMFFGISGDTVQIPNLTEILIGLAAQQQAAAFFQSDGQTIPDPNTFLPSSIPQGLFEIPARLPVDLGY